MHNGTKNRECYREVARALHGPNISDDMDTWVSQSTDLSES